MQPFIKFFIVGIVIVLIGIFNIIKGSKMKSKCTESTSARIVEIEKGYDTIGDDNSGTEYKYTPIYEFSVNGTTVRKSAGVYSNNKRKYHVGDMAVVKYNPDNPTEFMLNGKNTSKSVGIFMSIIGIAIVVIGFTQM